MSGRRAVLPNEVLGRYVVLHRLGAGGMGVVYAAYDPKLDRKVALKLLRNASCDPSKRERAQQRLLAEARALARLRHPNVIAVHDVAVHRGQVVVAMEFVDGETLKRRLARKTTSWRAVVDLMTQAGLGLAAAHAASMVHRDFKPDNVMLSREGRAQVMDFGLARALDLEAGDVPPVAEPDAGQLAGTPAYMAPEQHHGGAVDGRSDQFSFCVTFYEALFGHRPFAADRAQTLIELVERQEISPPGPATKVPGWVRAIVRRGLAYDPQDRFPNMPALLGELSAEPVARRRRRVRALSGAGVVFLGGSWAAFGPPAVAPHVPCAGAQLQLSEVWDAKRRGLVEEAASRPMVVHELDAWTQSWVAMHRETCEATRVRHEQSGELFDLRMECLGRRLREFDALAELLADDAAQTARAGIDAAAQLVPVAVCGDAARLKARVPMPDDPRMRERIEDLRASLAVVKVHADAGRFATGLALAKVAVDRSRATGHDPTLAEALLLEARLAVAIGDTLRAEPLLRESIQTAAAGRDDRTAAKAWTALLHLLGQDEARGEQASEVADAARAAVVRAGSAPGLRAEFAWAVGLSHLRQRRLDAAHDQLEFALERQREVAGPGHPSLVRFHESLASALFAQERFRSALHHLAAAISIQRQSHGSRHPSLGPMKAKVGRVLLAQGRPREARKLLEAALSIEGDSKDDHRALSGEVLQLQFALAKVLSASEPQRALRLARAARVGFDALPALHPLRREIAAVDAWIALQPSADPASVEK